MSCRPPAIPGGWASFYLQSPVTLAAGNKYALRPIIAQSGVSTVALQKGWQRLDGKNITYTFSPQTFFNDGHAQEYLPAAAAWSDKISEQGAATDATDWMFYLD